MRLLRAVAVPALVALASCATYSGAPGPAAPAPTFQPGDRFVYHVEDGAFIEAWLTAWPREP